MNTTAPKKILFMEYGIGFGGSSISLSELTNEIAKSEDYIPHILTFQRKDIASHYASTIRIARQRRFINYTVRERLNSYLNTARLPYFLKKLITTSYNIADLLTGVYFTLFIVLLVKSRSIDLIHINNTLVPEAIRAAKLAKIPCVAHQRELFSLSTKVIRDVARYQHGTIRKIIAISTEVKKSFDPYPEIDQQLIDVIPNSVNAPAVKEAAGANIRSQLSINSKDLLIGIFGRILPWKGQFEAVKAFVEIAPSCPRYKLVIVGSVSDSGNSKYFDEIQDFLSQGNHGSSVSFVGYQTDVNAYYSACDVILHCSVKPEPFGRVIIEGMANNKTVIAPNEGGPIDIITDDVDGIFYEARSHESLKSTLIKIYESEELRQRLSNNALQTARTKYTSDKTARSIMEIYDNILRGQTE